MANPQPDKFTRFSNELLDAYILVVKNISPYENAVWLCIFRKTYGFRQKDDWISLSQIEQLTMIRQPHVARTKKKLLSKNMIVKRNNGIGIQKDYEQWNIPKQVYLNRYIPKQALPKQVISITQTGNKTLPKQVDTKESKETYTKETTLLFDFFLLKTKKNFKLTPARAKLIKDRLETYTIDDIKKAIDIFVQDTWEGRKDHMDLVYCIGVRNKIDNLEKWLNKAEQKKPYDAYAAREAIGRIKSGDNRK